MVCWVSLFIVNFLLLKAGWGLGCQSPCCLGRRARNSANHISFYLYGLRRGVSYGGVPVVAGIAHGQDPAFLGALVNWLLLQSYHSVSQPAAALSPPDEGIPWPVTGPGHGDPLWTQYCQVSLQLAD
jgi:hypothetical protein